MTTSNISNQPSENSGTDQQILFPEGESHGCRIYLQIDDDNQLARRLAEEMQKLDSRRKSSGDSDSPHHMGLCDVEWTEGPDELGFFSSIDRYGCENDGEWKPGESLIVNTYSDVSHGDIANNPAKRRVEIHPRKDELTYEDGNDFSWPPGWRTGERYEGTLLKIQASHGDQPGKIIHDAFVLIGLLDVIDVQQLEEYKQQLIPETIRFGSPESYHRLHENHEEAVISTLQDTAKLVATKGSGKERGLVEKGHYELYGFTTDRLDFLGYPATVTWTYKGEEYSHSIDSWYIKIYRHTSWRDLPNDDNRRQPKVEVRIQDTLPLPAWNAVKKLLDTILNSLTHDLAGVPRSGLVPDQFHSGRNQEQIQTDSPRKYRIQLKDYFEGHSFKQEVISLLEGSRTKSAKDILVTILYHGKSLTYDDICSETGLAKSTVRKWVKRMEEITLLQRKFSGKMFISISDFVAEELRQWLDKHIPVGDVLDELKRRKRERKRKRAERRDKRCKDEVEDEETDIDEDPRRYRAFFGSRNTFVDHFAPDNPPG
jgi:DNA-binding transcriptional regulator GbsR (MarR family)